VLGMNLVDPPVVTEAMARGIFDGGRMPVTRTPPKITVPELARLLAQLTDLRCHPGWQERNSFPHASAFPT
jgi:hypothetical protein